MEGSDAALEWDFSAVNKEADLRRIKWSVYKKFEDDYYPLAVEYPNGTVKLNSAVRPEYDDRIKKESRGTFVIKSVRVGHSNRFKCTLEGRQGVAEISSTTELVVTGAVCPYNNINIPLPSPAFFAEQKKRNHFIIDDVLLKHILSCTYKVKEYFSHM